MSTTCHPEFSPVLSSGWLPYDPTIEVRQQNHDESLGILQFTKSSKNSIQLQLNHVKNHPLLNRISAIYIFKMLRQHCKYIINWLSYKTQLKWPLEGKRDSSKSQLKITFRGHCSAKMCFSAKADEPPVPSSFSKSPSDKE